MSASSNALPGFPEHTAAGTPRRRQRLALLVGVGVLVGALGWPARPGSAEIYRWRDDAGRLHLTDNPATIPPAYRQQARPLRPAAPAPATATPPPSTSVTPRASGASSPTASTDVEALRQRAEDLKQQIAAAEEERQTYLEQLSAEREIRTSPAFGRQRRRIDTLGRALADVERRLDALRSDLQQVQTQLRTAEAVPTAQTPPASRQTAAFDRYGHDQRYWQRRFDPVLRRLEQARARRQTLLERLASDDPRRTFGRRAQEVLRLTRELKQVEQEIRTAEAELQALRQEAVRAGAPAAWLP